MIDTRITLINDARRGKMRKLTSLITTINGMYDEITGAYEEMRDLYDDLIENENQMIDFEREDLRDEQQKRMNRIILKAADNGRVTLDMIISKVENSMFTGKLVSAERHWIAMAVSNLANVGLLKRSYDSEPYYETVHNAQGVYGVYRE